MEYIIDCPICDIMTTIEVHRADDEQPVHCPMCGSDADMTTEDEG